jgi:acetyl-CoA C-acetyltransferase
MACATSMAAVFEAAGQLGFGGRDVALCGGVESMSRVQLGLKEGLSVWLRRLSQARSMEDRLQIASQFDLGEVGLFIPSVKNRVTGKSMGEHCEEMAKEWEIPRQEQDEIALQSHRRAVRGSKEGFFDDLIVEVDGHSTDSFPREDTSLEALAKLRPSFDRDNGTITAGNSSPLTDGAAGVWLATDDGLARLPDDRHRVRLLDWEVAGVDIHNEGLLMAPGYAVPRLLTRHEMTYEDVGLWEIHEAFAAQILCNIESFESDEFLRERVGLEDPQLGEFPRERLNPNGGSVALGHPFGATGARILSQATKELAEMDAGTRAVVSICADGGLGAVALLEAG